MLERLMKRFNRDETKVDGIVLTDSHGERSVSAIALRNELRECQCTVEVESNINNALEVASKLVSDKDTPIVVLGSFDVVSRARTALNISVLECNDP